MPDTKADVKETRPVTQKVTPAEPKVVEAKIVPRPQPAIKAAAEAMRAVADEFAHLPASVRAELEAGRTALRKYVEQARSEHKEPSLNVDVPTDPSFVPGFQHTANVIKKG